VSPDSGKKGPILDNHMHLDLEGHCVEAAREFEKAGGTAIMLVDKPKWSLMRTDAGMREQYGTTLRIADMVRQGTGLKVFVTLAPHPALLPQLVKEMSLGDAVALMRKGIDIAAGLVSERKVVALGEVGRPHFPVPEEIMEASNAILVYAMERAKDVGCPVTLHTESSTEETFKFLAGLADKVGIKHDKVIKHFSPPMVDERLNQGLFPSIVASKDAIQKALSQGDRFLMETDYLDDMKRPGAVMGPKTVPKRTLDLLRAGKMTEEQAIRIHKEHPERIYGIDLSI
jgi:TatD-related deoxyribonuclease